MSEMSEKSKMSEISEKVKIKTNVRQKTKCLILFCFVIQTLNAEISKFLSGSFVRQKSKLFLF